LAAPPAFDESFRRIRTIAFTIVQDMTTTNGMTAPRVPSSPHTQCTDHRDDGINPPHRLPETTRSPINTWFTIQRRVHHGGRLPCVVPPISAASEKPRRAAAAPLAFA
jgi:hypothetical protein